MTLGDKIKYSGSFVSDIERCHRMPGVDFAQACDCGLDLPGTFARAFQRISQESFPGWFAPVLPYETKATKIQNWDMRYLPGLLQTADYARAVIRAGRPDDPDDIVERDRSGQDAAPGDIQPQASSIRDGSSSTNRPCAGYSAARR